MKDDHREYSEEEKQQLLERYVGTAVHEAGHVVAAYVLGIEFEYVTIETDPETGAIGSVRTIPWPEELVNQDDFAPEVRKLQQAHIIFSLAGGIAERRLASQVKWKWDVGDFPDIQEATDLAFIYGNDDLATVMDDAWEKAHEIIESNWPIVRTLAWALVEKHHIEKKEVLKIIEDIKKES